MAAGSAPAQWTRTVALEEGRPRPGGAPSIPPGAWEPELSLLWPLTCWVPYALTHRTGFSPLGERGGDQ